MNPLGDHDPAGPSRAGNGVENVTSTRRRSFSKTPGTVFLIGIPAAAIVLLLGRARCLSRGGCCWGAPDERQRHE